MRGLLFVGWAYFLALVEIAWRNSGHAWGEAQWVPHLHLILLVWICRLDVPLKVMWAAFGLGVLADLSVTLPGDAAVVLGPHAIAYMVAAYAVQQLRKVMVKNAVFTLTFGTLVAGLVVAVLTTVWLGMRKVLFADMAEFGTMAWFGGWLMETFMAAIVALLVGLVINSFGQWLGLGPRGRTARKF